MNRRTKNRFPGTPAFSGPLALALLGVLILGIVGCGDSTGPKGPKGPGEFQIQLLSPNGAEGSAVLEISGGTGLGDVSLSNGMAYQYASGGVLKVILILDTPGSLSFRVEAQDVADLPTVTVVQVADGDDALRSSVSGYQAQVVPVEAGNGQGGAP